MYANQHNLWCINNCFVFTKHNTTKNLYNTWSELLFYPGFSQSVFEKQDKKAILTTCNTGKCRMTSKHVFIPPKPWSCGHRQNQMPIFYILYTISVPCLVSKTHCSIFAMFSSGRWESYSLMFNKIGAIKDRSGVSGWVRDCYDLVVIGWPSST